MSSAVEAVTPFHEPSRKRRLVKIGGWIAGLLALAVVLHLLGVDVLDWLDDVWKQIKDVPVGYLVLGGLLQVLQTSLNGLAYYGILAYAYPGRVQLWPIITAYAVGVAMNNFLPANIGTFVTLLMFVAIIPGSTFPGILAAYMVNKIFFTIVGGLVYLYLFLEAGSAFDVELGWFRDHGALALLLFLGGVFLVVVVVRIFWRWLKKLWAQAKEGGKILASPRAFVTRVLLPQLGSYAAKVGVIMVFLAAYSIPVTFDSVMSVIGSSSAANMTAVTPGSVGITQAANVVALNDYTNADTATAYSLSQQLVTTVVNLGYGLLLVVLIFGWTGGKLLVSQSYAEAKVKAREMKDSRRQGDDPTGDGEPAEDA
ncbi:MAG TPA: lysylphosphatidylglycerol synthase domain-containing protein [Gaiella sp.]|uniref:lysylphosphatidylglycerol synthase domain-containing protein n=1 Tax=Gaiella sp. TaxID=2663207 RepID=UPI002D809D7A|nr:lysylphosphatidylglycerol synthase domain-containing protein [Gaiella sp.]HET9287888.1 lysylphosphatidylglycerol synthase domain-containing protein [Gaiella sp.]